MAQCFAYRIVKKTYKNYVPYDEGPGSAASIDATCSKRVVRERSEVPKSFGDDLLENGWCGLHMEEGSDDGYYEYSYVIEYATDGTDEWQFLGHLPRTVMHQYSRCGDELEHANSDCCYCSRY